MNLKTLVSKALILILLVQLTALGHVSVRNSQKSSTESAILETPTVEYCKLMEKPEAYFEKSIRVQALYRDLISNESILWSDCGEKIAAVSVGFPIEALDELSLKKLGKMRTLEVFEAKVIVVGVFRGPRSPGAEFNYGHMGWSKFKFEIISVEQVERGPKRKTVLDSMSMPNKRLGQTRHNGASIPKLRGQATQAQRSVAEDLV